VAGSATPTGSAGHATAVAKAKHELTFQPDHPVGTDHWRTIMPESLPRVVEPAVVSFFDPACGARLLAAWN
jgi:hypothetical protein